jgi:DNA-binding XRE family transcriptional regulator
MNTFGERLKTLRGKNYKDKIAKDLGLHPQTYGRYEAGTRKPDSEMIVKIANHYNVSTDYLLGLTDHPTNDKDLASAAEYLGISQSAAKEIKGLKTDLQKNVLKELARYLKSLDFGNMIENTEKMIVFNEFHSRCIREYCVLKNIKLQFDDEGMPIDEQGDMLSFDEFNEWLFDYDEKLYYDYKSTINDLVSTVDNDAYLNPDEEFLHYKQTKATERLMDSLLEEMYGDQSYFEYCEKYVENIFNLFEHTTECMNDVKDKIAELYADFMCESMSHRYNISDAIKFIDNKKAGE